MLNYRLRVLTYLLVQKEFVVWANRDMKYQAQLFAEQKITVLEIVLFPQSWTEAANYVVSYKIMMSAMK